MVRGLLGVLAAVSGAPMLVLGLLVAEGALAPRPALVMGAAVLGSGLGGAILLATDLDRLRRALRRAAAVPHGSAAGFVSPPRLRALAALTREISQVEHSLAAQAASLGRLRQVDTTIVDALPDPLLVLDEDRTVRHANPAAAAFGADLAALLRQPALRAAIDRAYAQGTAQHTELAIPAPVARDLRASVIPLARPPACDHPGGASPGVDRLPPRGADHGGRAILVLSDRTHERAIERMRADFVANASHELRTPLASLMGFIETLRGPARDDPPAQSRFLAIMAEQAERMNRLIDGLLSLSRVETSEHQAPGETVDLAALVRSLVAEFEPRVAARRTAVETRIADGLPPVRGDADQLAQVLANLLDNAVKYGAEGGVLRVSLTGVDGGRWPARPGLVLAVSDNGPGIARLHIPRLTERFYRVDKGRSRTVGGTGLGLAIVKHIVNRHRGQLLVESEEGRGATFSVWLPAGGGPVPARA